MQEGGTECILEDIEHAIDRKKIGIEIRSYRMSEEDIMNTACHEVGHALVAYFTGLLLGMLLFWMLRRTGTSLDEK